MNIGILALQGAFAAHQRVLTDLGASVTLVRGVEDVDDLDGIVLPGGESTTMSMLLDSSGIDSGANIDSDYIDNQETGFTSNDGKHRTNTYLELVSYLSFLPFA